MIDSEKPMEKFLQNQRFGIVKPYLVGDVLDFGGNKGELGKLVSGKYVCVNYNHTDMKGEYDSIISLATIEHLEVSQIYEVFAKFKKMLKKEGRIVITTPTPASKLILEMMANIGLTDKENIEEHKHYWVEDELFDLAWRNDLIVVEYRKFQFGFNQIVVMMHKV